MEVHINELTPKLFLELYSSVGWEPPAIDQVETALQHTIANFTAYDGDKPVGMVRLLGDCGMSFYIKDFAVIPSYRSKGAGSLLIHALEKYIKDIIPSGRAVSLELISTKEAVPLKDFFGTSAKYIELKLFHVSEPFRCKGIGKELFKLACGEAKMIGAEKIYISSHSSKESQAAYRSLGCVDAVEINKEIAENEPFDIQMEYCL